MSTHNEETVQVATQEEPPAVEPAVEVVEVVEGVAGWKKSRLVLVLDTETTGVDPEADELAEVGFCVVDIRAAKIRSVWSELVKLKGPNHAVEINGITEDLSPVLDRDDVAGHLRSIAPYVEAVVAHNASFDRPWLPELHSLPWVCTLIDYPWPGVSKVRSLADLALRYGVGVVRAHRAFDDVLTLATVMERQGAALEAQFDEALRRSQIPKILVRAILPIERKDEAKAAGFKWDPAKRHWWKSIPETAVDSFSFKVVPIITT